MTTLVRRTAGEVVMEAADLLGVLVHEFTATAGAAGTVTAPDGEVSETLDTYKSQWMYIYAGTSAGDSRRISGSSTGRVLTAGGNFTTTPDTTSKVLVIRAIQPMQIYRAVERAVRRLSVQSHVPLTVPVRAGNLLWNGGFEHWNSASNVASGSFIYTRFKASDGWAVRGTGAIGSRESTFARNRGPYAQYAGKMISDGTNEAFFEWAVPDWGKWAGKTVALKGWAYTTTASRVNLRVLDGVNTFATDTGGTAGTHTGTAGWEELSEASMAISAAATKLVIECRISSGGAVTAYFDDVRLLPADVPYYTRLDAPFTDLTDITKETGTEGVFYNDPMPKRHWRVLYHEDGFPYVHFATGIQNYQGQQSERFLGLGSVTQDRQVLLQGAGYRTDTVAVGTNVEFNPQLIAYMAAAEIAQGRLDGGDGNQRYYNIMREAKEMLAALPRSRAPHGSVRVRE